MELADPGIELGREGGHPRMLERAGGDDHLARLVTTIAGGGNERAAVAIGGFQPLDADARVDREPEAAGVCLEVVGHLAAGRERTLRERERHAGKRGVARRRVQLQCIVATSPDVPHAGVGLDDPVVDALPLQVVAGGQPGLAGSDDEDVGADRGRLAVAVIGRSSLVAAR